MSHVHLPAPDCAPCGPEPPRLPLSCLAPPGSVFPSQLCLSKACPPSLSSFLTSNLLSSSLLLTRSVPWRASHQGNVSRGGTCSRPGDTCGLAAAQSPHTRSPSFWNLPPLPKCRGFEAWCRHLGVGLSCLLCWKGRFMASPPCPPTAPVGHPAGKAQMSCVEEEAGRGGCG